MHEINVNSSVNKSLLGFADVKLKLTLKIEAKIYKLASASNST